MTIKKRIAELAGELAGGAEARVYRRRLESMTDEQLLRLAEREARLVRETMPPTKDLLRSPIQEPSPAAGVVLERMFAHLSDDELQRDVEAGRKRLRERDS